MDAKIIITILSSSFLAAIITSLASGMFSLKLKEKEFLYEYHKKILEKRMLAYENIETLIAILKGSVFDKDDEKTYHQIFAFGSDEFVKHMVQMQYCMSQGMWLSNEVTKQINQLNYIYLNVAIESDDLIDFGKSNYSKIVEERNILEKAFSGDIGELHKIQKFIERKATEVHEYNLVEIKKS